MTLYSEQVISEVMAVAYPVSSLRNKALKQAKTEASIRAASRTHGVGTPYAPCVLNHGLRS